MPRHQSLAELLSAVDHGGPRPDILIARIDIGHDNATIRDAAGTLIYEARPVELLQQALEALGLNSEEI